MGLFDIFTGDPQKKAAEAQRGVYQGAATQIGNLSDFGRNYTEPLLNQGFADARGELTSGYGTAGNALTTGFEGARGDLSQGYGAATGAINQGAAGALGYLGQGSADALGRLDQAKAGIGGAFTGLQGLADQYGVGAGMYANALGLNGAAGNAAAQQAFQATPGYEFQMGQGLDAINRRRNLVGGVSGGNADRDAQTFGQGLAATEQNKWLDRLGAYNQLQLGATGAAATGTAGENATRGQLDVTGANLLNQTGQNRAAVASAQGNNLADLASRYYGGQASLDTTEGGAMSDLARQYYGAQAGLDTGQGGALTSNAWQSINPQIQAQGQFAQPTANSYMDAANAQTQGSKNLWGLGMAAASALSGMPVGGSTFGGQALGGLMSGFGGSAAPATQTAFAMPNFGFANPTQRA